MKTIFVTYESDFNTKYKKRYCFNTEFSVQVGDVINSPKYSSKMKVVEVLDKSYTYFNRQTGDLTDEIDSTNCFKISTINIIENMDCEVFGFLERNNEN